MPIRVLCPACKSMLSVSDELCGRQVRCSSCKAVMKVPPPVPGSAAPAPSNTAKKPAAASPPAKRPVRASEIVPGDPPRGKSARDNRAPERNDRLPTSRRRDDDDWDDEDRPRQRSRRRDDDDDEERRPSRGRREESKRSLLPWIIGGAGGVVGLGLVGVALYIALGTSAPAPAPKVAVADVAQNRQPAAAQPFQQPAAVAPANPPAAPVTPAPAQPNLPPPPPVKQVEAPAGPLPTLIAPENTRRVKNATAFLRVAMPGGGGAEGSGFFAAEPGLVFTNAHVLGMLSPGSAPPVKVEVVVHSGEATEFTLEGQVLGVDRDNDLGVLRVGGDPAKLPPPLAVGTSAALIELQKVYIFGFPLGSQLGKEITVSESSVSSLRKGRNGIMKEIQVNGGMHQGNSGGPVVDSNGTVVGVAVAVYLGTQINFAVPGEHVQSLLRGRVTDTLFGDAFVDGSQAKLPIEFQCLDPLLRIRDFKLDVWSGEWGPARPLSLKQPGAAPGDGPRQTVAITYQNGKATTELSLPSSTGKVLWVQPVLTDAAGSTHWAAATAYKLSEFPPLVRRSAKLQQRFDGPGERSLSLKSELRLRVTKGSNTLNAADFMEMDALETAKTDSRGGLANVFVGRNKFTSEINGRGGPQSPPAQERLRNRVFTFVLNPQGGLVQHTIPVLPKGKFELGLRLDFEDLVGQVTNAFEMTCLPVPNKELQPKESWPVRLPIIFSSPSKGKKKTEVLDMFLTCTYEGTRQYRGENQAVIALNGILKPRQFSRNQAGGKVTGRVHFAIEQGFVSLARLKVQSEGTAQIGPDEVAVTRTMDVDVSRVAGNTTGLVAREVPVPPPAGAAPLRVAQGKSVLQTNLVLGAADPANHPAKPGCTFKVVNADFTAGKTYIIEMIKTDASVLDPFLLLYDPKGQLVAKDDDSAGNLDARIVHAARESGSYRIHATTLAPGMYGAVQVRVYEGIGSALAKGPAPPAQPLQPGPATAPVAQETPPPGWSEFSPNDRSFSVWVPQQGGRRSTRQRNFTVRGLRLKVNIIQFDANNGPLLSASTLQFPPQVLRNLPLQKRIELFRDLFLEEVKGTVEDETELTQGRVPGREYLVSTGQGQARLRVYALGARVYRAVVIGTQQQVQSKGANTFLNSFRLPSLATTGIPAAGTPGTPGGVTSGGGAANVGQGTRPPPGNLVPPAGALNMIGDVFAFGADAVKENRLADVDLRGFKLHKNDFRQTLDEGAILIGFQVGYGQFVNKRTINAVRPIFLTKSGEKMGSWHGPASPNPVIVKAKEGYVVGSMSIRTALAIDGFSIKFIKLTKNGIDPTDNYDSEWVGGNGGRPETIGAQGGLFVGICGKLDPQGVPAALGLVAALPK